MSNRHDRPTPCFEFREENGVWAIYDNRSGGPVVLNGTAQTGLGLDEADDLTAVLNRVEEGAQSARRAREA
jgi:hypothetical protein